MTERTGGQSAQSSGAGESRAAIKQLFIEASELPLEQRDALLQARCAGDARLRAAVESLLGAADHATRFMSDPTVAEGADAFRITVFNRRAC